MFRFIQNSLLFILFLIYTLPALAYGGGENSNTSDWELIENESGIKVYERWVNTEKNVKVRERTGKMTLNGNLEEVIALIKDTEKIPLWMSSVESVNQIKTKGENVWFVHTVLDAPWPFSKQDMVSKYTLKKQAGSKTAKVTITRALNLVPVQDDVTRLDSFNAIWEIEQIKKNKVRITFTTRSTKPPEYPCWMQDPVVRKIFFSNLRNFKSLITQEKA